MNKVNNTFTIRFTRFTVFITKFLKQRLLSWSVLLQNKINATRKSLPFLLFVNKWNPLANTGTKPQSRVVVCYVSTEL
jgi:hypothetical protein